MQDLLERVFLIHGWSDPPVQAWFPWLKQQLAMDNCRVHIPLLPNPDHPTIQSWTEAIREAVRVPDSETYFVCHDLGCQAVLRYLQGLPLSIQIGGVVCVAPGVRIKPERLVQEEAYRIAKPWIDTPIHWEAIMGRTRNFVAIFSDNDPMIYVEDGKMFQQSLGAEIIIEHQKGHYMDRDGTREMPSVLHALRKMMGREARAGNY